MANVKKYEVSVALAVNTNLETRKELDRIAEKEGKSRSDLVNEFIIEGIERRQK